MYKTFRDFILEDETGGGPHVGASGLEKTQVDLVKDVTRNEINRNLSAELYSHDFINPYNGWIKARRVLSMYNVFLPRVIFNDLQSGEEIVDLSQFGNKWGAKLSGEVSSPTNGDPTDYCFYYHYYVDPESGFYKCKASLLTPDELDQYIENQSNVQRVPNYGMRDPRQPK
jgi:hypothetical protein